VVRAYPLLQEALDILERNLRVGHIDVLRAHEKVASAAVKIALQQLSFELDGRKVSAGSRA
jgi:hypothetical protein